MVGTRAVQVHPHSREKGAPIRFTRILITFYLWELLGI